MSEPKSESELFKLGLKPDFRKVLGLEIHPTIFFVSAGLISLFVVFGLVFNENLETAFDGLLSDIATNMGWFYIFCANFFLGFVIFLLFSRLSQIRLGGKDAKSPYSWPTWFAMLFSAGMGIGLLFWSVAEPIYHFDSPPRLTEGGTPDAAREAMLFTFYHWGLHAWAIYAVVGACIAFFAYNRKLPLTIRSALYPLIGERIYGWMGSLVDILAVVATLFGVATSLGLGVQQINAGLNHLFSGVPETPTVQIVLIAAITGAATVSVVLGLNRGIRRLSELNMIIALLLMLTVLAFGPTVFILKSVLQNTGTYLDRILPVGFWAEAYRSSTWQHSWTIFYWGWWIAWSPFVGMFIARISYGRTLREFLAGVLLVPSILTFLWLSIFGNTALYLELFGDGGIVGAVKENVAVSLFVLLENYPAAALTSGLAIIVVTTFFITSSDSASLVIDTITAGGHPHPPVRQKIFWATTEGTVAAVLLVSGGLTALQTASITTGLPFAFVLLVMCWGLYRGLRQEHRQTFSSTQNGKKEKQIIV